MSSFRRMLLFLFLTLNVVSVTVSLAGHKTIPFVTRVDVKNNLKYSNSSVQIASTPNESRLNLDFNALQTIHIPRVIVVLWLDVGAGALQAPFYNQTVDFCILIKNPGTHRLVQIVYRELKRHGNLPTGCPIPSGSYKFRDLSTSRMRLPPFFKDGAFMMDIIGLTGTAKVHTIDTRWYGTINSVKCTTKVRC